MTVSVQCPSCHVSLKIRNIEILRRSLLCPQCREPIPGDAIQEEEEYVDAEIVDAEAVDAELVDAEVIEAEVADDSEEITGIARPVAAPLRNHPPIDAFLQVHTPNISFMECWWSNRNPLVVIAWLLKILRVPLPSSPDDPAVKTLEQFQSAYRKLSPETQKVIEPAAMELQREGFRSPAIYAVHHPLHSSEYHVMVVPHQTGEAIAHVQNRVWTGVSPVRRDLFVSFVTAFADGTFLITTNARPDMKSPTSVDLRRHQGAGIEQLWAQHQEHVAMDGRSSMLRRTASRDEAKAVMEELHSERIEFHSSRGVFKPLSKTDREKIQAVFTRPVETSGRTCRHADVMTEIEKRQDGKSSWVSAIVVLVISAAFFLGLGQARWSWKTTWILLPVLLFHELGHFVAMKAFGYRNLKMFFIPLFGAAVTGAHYNVEGWKKIVVSLAGPVPGILLGTVIGIVGLTIQSDLTIEVAVMMLILNGLNLFPLLPLDGGWIAHGLFFSRHYAVDVFFRVLTALLLLGISIAIDDKFLIGLGVILLIGIPNVLRSGRIVHRLKDEDLAVSQDEQTIPPTTAERIIDEIEEEYPPAGLNNKLKAQFTLDIFQSINTKAPGVGGTILLTAVHVGSLLLAFVMAIVLAVGQHTGFGDLMALVYGAPEAAYECGTSEVAGGDPDEASLKADDVCVIGSFTSHESAAKAFEESQGAVAGSAVLRLFGQTLLLAVPADDLGLQGEWAERFEALGATVSIRSKEQTIPFSLTFISPTEEDALRIDDELKLYFQSVTFSTSVLPPWHPESALSEQHVKARRTLMKLQRAEEGFRVADTPEAKELQAEIEKLNRRARQARQRKNEVVAKAANEEIAEKRKLMETLRIEFIRDLGPDEVDLDLIDAYLKQPVYQAPEDREAAADAYKKFTEDQRLWHKTLAPFLGQAAERDGEPLPEENRYGGSTGYSSCAGLIHRIDYMQFHREVDGVAAIAKWLCDQDCVDIKYRFESPLEDYEDYEDYEE